MDKAQEAVASFLSKDGHRDTTVHEVVNPAVQNEHITPTRHEQVQTAVEKEVHQDHHHTSVQPIVAHEVLPEQHSHKLAATKHREVVHGNDDDIKQKLAAEQAQFKNTSVVGETQVSASTAPTVVGEHVHHHVHEHIQPVIQKETIQPTVIHTTVPIHEVHHNEAKHHTATELPPMTISEFEKAGGSLAGREERSDAFVGEPKTVGGTIGGQGAAGTTSLTEKESVAKAAAKSAAKSADTHHSSSTTGTHHSSSTTDTTSGSDKEPGKIAHLLDKLNPKKDSNGDGKAGFMS